MIQFSASLLKTSGTKRRYRADRLYSSRFLPQGFTFWSCSDSSEGVFEDFQLTLRGFVPQAQLAKWDPPFSFEVPNSDAAEGGGVDHAGWDMNVYSIVNGTDCWYIAKDGTLGDLYSQMTDDEILELTSKTQQSNSGDPQ